MNNNTHCRECKEIFEKYATKNSPGYGVKKNGDKICYKCCANETKKQMEKTGKTYLYFSGNKLTGYRISDWPGFLKFQPINVSRSQGRGFGGMPYPILTCQFVGPDGYIWNARNAGNNSDIANCKRTKKRA